MRLTRMRLRHFRNHNDTQLTFGEGINAFFGDNGQGKTNVLEAISYLSLTKSFYATSDRTVLQYNSAMFEVEGEIVSDNALQHTIRVTYTREGEKFFTINGVKPERMTSVIGQFPIVVLSPENSAITFGSPAERRAFLDLLLSQISPTYLEDLLEYRRALKQRNKLLSDGKHGRWLQLQLVEPWTEGIVNHGARIIRRRAAFLDEFRPRMKDAYAKIVSDDRRMSVTEDPDLMYITVPGAEKATTTDEIRVAMHEELQRRSDEERRRGTTLVGPHRDDILFTLNKLSLQHYASQGQHKTMLIALKLAEYLYLRERRDEVPIMLLDDVFSELDERRATHVIAAIHLLGQTFVTTTDERIFGDSVRWNGRHRKFYVAAGMVRHAGA